MIKNLSKEYSVFLALITMVGMFYFEHTLASTNMGNMIGFGIIFGVIIYSSLAVAHHAEKLAEKFGEPYGTLILTISAVLVEIVIIVIMMNHSGSATLARDTIYSAIMLDINGLLGVAAIIGGIKYGEQPYNVDSSNSYLGMLIAAIGISMIIPHFITENHQAMYSMFIVIAFLALYVVFTKIQLSNHKYFFEYKAKNCKEEVCEVKENHEDINAFYHSFVLIGSIVIIGILSEILSVFMEHTLSTFNLPLAIGAVTVALISASPELITAVRAALDNRMQTVVNIALGASLATILLTVPAVIVLSKMNGLDIDLALTPLQGVMFGLTILIGIVNFSDGETNVLEGFLHFILFIVFIFLIFV